MNVKYRSKSKIGGIDMIRKLLKPKGLVFLCSAFGLIISGYVDAQDLGSLGQTNLVANWKILSASDNTFTFQIPESWDASAATFSSNNYFGSIDKHQVITTNDPDHAIYITYGDPYIYICKDPRTGYTCGDDKNSETYLSCINNIKMFKLVFQTGSQFAEWYARRKANELSFTNFRTIDRRDYTDNSGYIKFECFKGNTRIAGRYYAKTRNVAELTESYWVVDYLYGYFSLDSKNDLAYKILTRLKESIQSSSPSMPIVPNPIPGPIIPNPIPDYWPPSSGGFESTGKYTEYLENG